MRSGACDYLNKPFNVSVVRGAIAKAAQRRSISEDILSSQTKLEQLKVEISNQQTQLTSLSHQIAIYASVLHDIANPLTAIAGGVTKAMGAAPAIVEGIAAGATTSAAQPLPGGQDELSMEKLKQAGIGGLLGGAFSAVGQGVKSFLGSNKLNPTQQATLKERQAAGYAVPPSMVNPSGLNNTLESLAGKAAVKQEAAARNQLVTSAIAPEDIGLPRGATLSEAVLDRIREKAGGSFAKLDELNPGGELRRLQVRNVTKDFLEIPRRSHTI